MQSKRVLVDTVFNSSQNIKDHLHDNFKDMTADQLNEMKMLCDVKTFTQKAGQMSYMPAGWIVVNKTSGGELVVGLRTTAVASDCLDEFKTYIENSHKHGLGDVGWLRGGDDLLAWTETG